MFILMPVIFVLGILAIALEDKIKINKAAIALFMAISMWMILMFDAYNIFVERSSTIFQEFLTQNPEMASLPPHEQFINFISNRAIVYHLGNVSETLFFVMCSMLIVDIVDKHGGFRAVTGYIRTPNKRKLLWYISFATFFFSALLDNLAAAIVIMAVLRKLVPDRTDRLKYACMVIIAANAGGSWSPIGDVTTILLWVGKNISAMHQISHVFIPALVNMLVPLTIAHFWLFKKGSTLRVLSEEEQGDEYIPEIPNRSRRMIRTPNKRKLLWYISFATFFFSALLDNLAAAIVIMAVLRKLVPDRTDRLKYACMVIIAANAGGSWSPIGDVTTILLWVGKNISAMHQISHVFIPALVNMLVPLTIAHFWLFKKGSTLRVLSEEEQGDEYIPEIPNRSRRMIFVIGVLSLALVPVFQMVTNLPPFLGVLLGLVILWFYTDLMYSKLHMHESQKLRISQLLPNIDLATIFFFLGILMAVGALETSGQLGIMSAFLDKHVHEPYLISFVIGALSSCVDNVALVAATMGMYPIVEQVADLSPYAQFFVSDGGFWTFLAYCAVTGGSILIIGSATGVTVMGLEKIDFMYYTKRFSILALIGYCCGAGVYMLLFA